MQSCKTLLSHIDLGLRCSSCKSLQSPHISPTRGSFALFDNLRCGGRWHLLLSLSGRGLGGRSGAIEYVVTAVNVKRHTNRNQMFLRFQGPANILLQARGNKLTDSLSTRDINEIADSPAGAMQAARHISPAAGTNAIIPQPAKTATKMTFASVDRSGKVDFEKAP